MIILSMSRQISIMIVDGRIIHQLLIFIQGVFLSSNSFKMFGYFLEITSRFAHLLEFAFIIEGTSDIFDPIICVSTTRRCETSTG